MRGNSRQTDLKLPCCIRAARFCRALLRCLSPPSHGSKASGRDVAVCSAISPCGRQIAHRPSARASPGRVHGGFVELAIERRAADFEPARDLRHLAAIMRDRETDDLVLRSLRAAAPRRRRSASRALPAVAQRCDRYFVAETMAGAVDGRRSTSGSPCNDCAVTAHGMRRRLREVGERRAGRRRS